MWHSETELEEVERVVNPSGHWVQPLTPEALVLA